MTEDRAPETKAGFSAVQGCLIGAVVLFVVLFGITIVLAYRQFKENTAPSTEAVSLQSATSSATPSLPDFGMAPTSLTDSA